MKFSHTFSICAYKESEYLEPLIQSLKAQLLKTNIIMCTSTPNDHIKGLAAKYDIPLYIRDGASDIKDDWNFAYNTAKTKYVTIAHQDDIYTAKYALELYEYIKKRGEKFSIYFTKYRPIKNGKVASDINCHLRSALLFRLRSDYLSNKKRARVRSLAYGNSICCPSVTYNKEIIGPDVFTTDLKFNIDWDSFLTLAKKDYPFFYNHKILTYYRVHPGATSMEFIKNNKRVPEDTHMFCKFWPKPIAKLVMVFYKKAYKTYL